MLSRINEWFGFGQPGHAHSHAHGGHGHSHGEGGHGHTHGVVDARLKRCIESRDLVPPRSERIKGTRRQQRSALVTRPTVMSRSSGHQFAGTPFDVIYRRWSRYLPRSDYELLADWLSHVVYRVPVAVPDYGACDKNYDKETGEDAG